MAARHSTGLGGMTNLSVLAPIKRGMVAGFEPVSYLERLRKVLDALHAARMNVRESELNPPFFPDAVGRFGIIHDFRYAIVPPDPEAAVHPLDGVWRLSLNVTFDGGWEPYMRVIYRDIGTLLDLLFCHCDGYPGSRTSRFEDYCAWVRGNEVEGGLFYTDSSMTLGDQQYLARVEKLQREQDPLAADAAIARLAIPNVAQQKAAALKAALADPLNALVLPLRTLKGLYRLSLYFPKGGPASHDDGDHGTLRRFARSLLEGPMAVIGMLDGLPAGPSRTAWLKAREGFVDELDWLTRAVAAAPVVPPLPYDPARLQSHIFGSNERMTHGVLLLLRIKDPWRALTWLEASAAGCGPVAPGGIGQLVAFTAQGLSALGLDGRRLQAFPQEFLDGMEARSALLGDLRGNHPDRWRRPLADAGDGHRVDLRSVHVVVQWRLADPAADPDRADLHPRLQAALDALRAAGSGLRVLAVQPTRSYRNGADQVSGHFDFADGLSQPQVGVRPEPSPDRHSDAVSAGELLLGHANDRGDAAHAGIEPLLRDGSFLVVRTLRQRVDHIDGALQALPPDRREEVLARMMGRRMDGTPLVPPAAGAGPNEFTYATPAASAACPFHAHVRRANPRDGRAYTPRILRRGMSYGPKSATDLVTPRGVVFMAYSASIAEQFETLQRWMAGGNSSGVGSVQSDPFLGVPQAGESRTYRHLDDNGQVVRVALGDQPWVELEWGLYLFVPSLPVLAALSSFRQAPAALAAPAPTIPVETGEARQRRIDEEERERVRQILDDPERAREAWKLVRDGSPRAPQNTTYGHLVGRCPQVLEIMKDDGHRHSVQGYGQRMSDSIGLNLLGMDPGKERTAQMPLNAAVAAKTEREAYDETARIVAKILPQFPDLPASDPTAPKRRPIDLVTYSDAVMAALCHLWIGLPDDPAPGQPVLMTAGGRLDENAGVPRCPGNFATASRYIFSPHLRTPVEVAGREQGQAVRQAVQDWLARKPALGTLAVDIQARLGGNPSDQTFGLSLAGVLLGFPPTVQGNFIRTMETWIKSEALWLHQEALYEQHGNGGDAYAQADAALRAPLLATMRQRPVPEMLWRTPVRHGQPDPDPSHRVVLGITSALTDPAAPDELMFGRDAPSAAQPTVHGCPGYPMAMGVMLAMLAGLMRAGTLRPTGSPVLLILTPN